MEFTNENGIKELWPMIKSIKNIMGKIDFEYWIKGCLWTLTESLKRPVIFLYKKDPNGANVEDNFEIIEDFRENDVPFNSPICKAFDRESCKKNDKEVTSKILSLTGANEYYKKKMFPIIIEDNGKKSEKEIQYYRYVCSQARLVEWFIPVMLQNDFCGAFITGQFDTNNDPENNATEFFEKINNIIESVEKRYNEKCSSNVLKIQSELLPIVRGDKDDERREPFRMQRPDIGSCFKAIRTDLADCLDKLIEPFNIKSIVIFKPSSSVDRLITLNKNRIESFVLDTPPPLSKRNYKDDMKHAEYAIDLTKDAWKNFKDSNEIQVLKTNENDIKNFLTSDSPELPENCILILFTALERKEFPIGYLISYEDETFLENNNYHLMKLLDYISSYYLIRWQKIYSEYLSQKNLYVSHELGQLCILLENRYKTHIKPYEKANLELSNNKDINKRVPDIANFVRNNDVFFFDLQRYHFRLKHISHVTKSSITDAPVEWIYFGVHKSVIYDLFTKNEKDAEQHFIKFGKLEWPVPGDQKRPVMYADPDKIMEIVNNLLDNAVKYSHWGSIIKVDAYMRRNDYIIEVVNYGPPIPDEDWKGDSPKIFEFGYRAKNAKENRTGAGAGLFFSNIFAQMHEGKLECNCEPISKFNVPLLNQNLIVLEDEDIPASKVMEEEFRRLYNEGYIELIVNPAILEDKNLMVKEVGNRINDPTAKITFTLSIPQERNKL